VVKRKIPSPCRDSNPPIIQPVASAIPVSYPGYDEGRAKKYEASFYPKKQNEHVK
jgi:hypothetical protein